MWVGSALRVVFFSLVPWYQRCLEKETKKRRFSSSLLQRNGRHSVVADCVSQLPNTASRGTCFHLVLLGFTEFFLFGFRQVTVISRRLIRRPSLWQVVLVRRLHLCQRNSWRRPGQVTELVSDSRWLLFFGRSGWFSSMQDPILDVELPSRWSSHHSNDRVLLQRCD